jgi:hypothetical protein
MTVDTCCTKVRYKREREGGRKRGREREGEGGRGREREGKLYLLTFSHTLSSPHSFAPFSQCNALTDCSAWIFCPEPCTDKSGYNCWLCKSVSGTRARVGRVFGGATAPPPPSPAPPSPPPSPAPPPAPAVDHDLTQFLYGDSVLVAPILTDDATRLVTLPAHIITGTAKVHRAQSINSFASAPAPAPTLDGPISWYEFNTTTTHLGGSTLPIQKLPLHQSLVYVKVS